MSSGCAYMTSQVPLKPPGSTAFPGDPVVKRPEETQEQVLWAGWEREREFSIELSKEVSIEFKRVLSPVLKLLQILQKQKTM